MQVQAGQKGTAALLAAIAGQKIVKPTDQQVTSSTALQNDNDLFLPVLANATYLIDFYINYSGGATGASDLLMQWSVPAGATMRYGADFQSSAGLTVVTGATYTAGTGITAGTNGTSNLMSVRGRGSLIVSTTAGNLQHRWAQVTSSATPTTVRAQSYLALVMVT